MSKTTFAFLWVLTFAIPFENMFVYQGFGTITRIIGAITVVLAILSIVMEKRSRPLGLFQFLFGVFTLWSMTSFFWSVDLEASRKAIITLAQLFFFIWLIWEFARSEKEQISLMKAYIFGAYVSFFSTVIAFLQGNQSSYLRYSASGFDPNDLGLILALGVPIAWNLALLTKKGMMAWLYRLYVPSAFFAITLTASRTSFLAFIVAALFIVWTYPQMNRWVKCSLWLVFSLLGYWFIYLVPSSSWSRLSTIGNEMASGSLNARTHIWLNGFEVFSNNPILGVGVGAFPAGVEANMGFEAASHNLFLSILVGQGLVGLLILGTMLIVLLASIFQMPPLRCKFWTILLATLLVGVMTLSWEHKKATWFLLGILASQGGKELNRKKSMRLTSLRGLR